MIKHSFSMFFNSSPAAGATQVSADGSAFSVVIGAGISFPQNAKGITVSCLQANIWYTTPNISADFANNIFQFTSAATPYTLTIPAGLYSVADLNSFIATSCVNLGLLANTISITGNSATGQVLLTLANAGDSVDFTSPASVRTLLGFDAGIYVVPSNGYTFASQNVAAFNRVNSYLITSNITAGGLPINQSASGVVASIPINVAPGSMLQFSPSQRISIAAPELAGTNRNNFRFQLVDQQLRPTPTAGETYNFVLQFTYYI